MEKDRVLDIFGNDITEQTRKAEIERKRKEAAKKGWATRREREERECREYDRMWDIAHTTESGDLFGNVPTDEERKAALEYIKNHKRPKGGNGNGDL